MAMQMYKRKWALKVGYDITNRVTCEICGKNFKALTSHLAAKHKISIREYNIKYPTSPTISINSSLKFSEVHKTAENADRLREFGREYRQMGIKRRRTSFMAERLSLTGTEEKVMIECFACSKPTPKNKSELFNYYTKSFKKRLFCTKECYWKWQAENLQNEPRLRGLKGKEYARVYRQIEKEKFDLKIKELEDKITELQRSQDDHAKP